MMAAAELSCRDLSPPKFAIKTGIRLRDAHGIGCGFGFLLEAPNQCAVWSSVVVMDTFFAKNSR